MVSRMQLDTEFWRGRRVLLTGHTGFKGAWLAYLLNNLGAELTGLSLAPNTAPSLFTALKLEQGMRSHIGDIRDAALVKQVVQDCQPEVVLHLAAQALVRPSYREPLATFATNIMGSAHVLEALRGQTSAKVAVMVTTDKVYRNLEQIHPYPETAELGGHDPYSASKAASELLIASYRDSFLAEQGLTVAVARAGNVIGGGDWSEDRLLPDAIRAWENGQPLQVRRPQSVRPWQHVLEPLAAYLSLAQAGYQNSSLAQAWNFGPDGAATVREVVELARHEFGCGDVDFAVNVTGVHEAGLLSLDASKAREQLSIAPRWDLSVAVSRSVRWYADFLAGVPAQELCQRDIDAYF
ncbi:CDP-glucose 4,6-dehydratase [Undibacterium sp. JH2W]|uniref:CDP-glucose 4,6-dehydratase n=1 Tax=Undibacterium sp. JH2W TaxID=3413037 RepID=UPI003BF0B20E